LNLRRYEPRPIDTSRVVLNGEIQRLTELLARNVHEIWARGRMAEGWSYGPQRNDTLKEHPCLVPYEQVPESEKEYDRSTAMETVKAVIALGYKIQREEAG
jgi:hypothetical protein